MASKFRRASKCRNVPKADAAITYIERFLRGPRLASTESGGIVKIILPDSNRTRRIPYSPSSSPRLFKRDGRPCHPRVNSVQHRQKSYGESCEPSMRSRASYGPRRSVKGGKQAITCGTHLVAPERGQFLTQQRIEVDE